MLSVVGCKDWWENQVSKGYFKKYQFGFSNPKTIARLGLDKDSVILEMGCGYGRETKAFCEISKHVYVVDIADSTFDLVNENVPDACWNPFDGKRLMFEDSMFDLVYSCFMIQHVSKESAKDIIRESLRVIKQDGKILHEFFENKSYYRGKDIDFLHGMYNNSYPVEDIKELVENCGGQIEWIDTKDYGILKGPNTPETEPTYNHWGCIKK